MELWVRSQDKEDLIKAEHIGVFNEKIYVDGYEENGCCIGTYKTKERALEVLDEIQEVLEQPKKHIEGDYTYYMPNDGSSKVYEMPQE